MWAHLGAIWTRLGAIWARLGAIWERLGVIWAHTSPVRRQRSKVGTKRIGKDVNTGMHVQAVAAEATFGVERDSRFARVCPVQLPPPPPREIPLTGGGQCGQPVKNADWWKAVWAAGKELLTGGRQCG
jgi:hypothetical protein